MDAKILAIIPARSGSKGIKDKNIKLLNGKPLIAYTIEAAIESNMFEDVIVSTDSIKYKQISEQYGAKVPFLRCKELSQDNTATNDVIFDVLTKLIKNEKKYDSFMLLQPTSPLRDKTDIINAVNQFYKNNYSSLVSMCECEFSPLLTKEICEDNSLDGFLSNLGDKLRRQDLSKYYRLNGAIYMCKTDYFLKYKNFYKENSHAFIMSREKSIDIDGMFDFKIAEAMIKENQYNM